VPVRWLLALLVVAAVAVALQVRTPISVVWAVLDVAIHGSLAGVCLVCRLPRWGPAPVIAAAAAGILIDLDHLVAARSPDPMAMMSLSTRPPTHSLAGILVLAAATHLFLGWRVAYAAFVGMLAHLLWDCVAEPGVVLLFPFVADRSVVLPVWAAVACLAGLTLFNRPLRGARVGMNDSGGRTA